MRWRMPDFTGFKGERVADDDLGGDVPQAELNVAHQRGKAVHVHALHPDTICRVVALRDHHLHQRQDHAPCPASGFGDRDEGLFLQHGKLIVERHRRHEVRKLRRGKKLPLLPAGNLELHVERPEDVTWFGLEELNEDGEEFRKTLDILLGVSARGGDILGLTGLIHHGPVVERRGGKDHEIPEHIVAMLVPGDLVENLQKLTPQGIRRLPFGSGHDGNPLIGVFRNDRPSPVPKDW